MDNESPAEGIFRIVWRRTPLIILSFASASIIFVFFRSRSQKKDDKPANSEEVSSTSASTRFTTAVVEEKELESNIGKPLCYVTSELYKGCIYLDYNATTPVYPEVASKIAPFIASCFGNPSSSHIFSDPARSAVKTARTLVGSLINSANPEREIYFTSCGTESDNRAIDIAMAHYVSCSSATAVPNIITSAIEHPAVLCYLRLLKSQGRITLTVIEVDETGLVNDEILRSSLSTATALVTVMHSNNEVGTIQPLRKIADAVKAFNRLHNVHILLHSDAAQSIGKVCMDVQSAEVDLMTIVGHKFGAPKGVAALYVREGVRWEPTVQPMLVGGGQEHGGRGGTENVALIAGLGEASRLADKEHAPLLLHLLALKLRMLTRIQERFEQRAHLVRINGPKRACNVADLTSDLQLIRAVAAGNSMLARGGHQSARRAADVSAGVLEQLPNTVSVSFKGAKSHEIIALLREKVACSAGSACHSVTVIPDNADSNGTSPLSSQPLVTDSVSDVLKAMKVPMEFALGTLRLSFGRHSTVQEIDAAVDHISAAVQAYWKERGIV